MTFPTAAGTPSHEGVMIPEIWSGKLLVTFYKSTVFGEIANTDYDGEIKDQGSVVHIRTTPNITIRDYKKGQKLTYDQPEPENVDLVIDRGKSWSFVSDDVTKHQADYAYLEGWTAGAAKDLKVTIDSEILGEIYADADVANAGAAAGKESGDFNLGSVGAPVALTKANILDYIVDLGTVLYEHNVPEDNRWLVLPNWACGLIKKSDLKDASLSGDGQSVLRNGRIGMIDQFTIYESNNLSKVLDGSTKVTNIVFGHKSALTFASQLVKNEGPLRFADTFGDFYRGLQVYGFSVIKPAAMGHLYAYKG